MASSKTLSTTTLNLRFMKNAFRSQEAKVELPKAPVKDDAEWEVSQAIRDAWGLSSSSTSRYPDVHEDSYLPFLFQDDDEPAPSKGRRTFGKNGKEVEVATAEKASDEATAEEQQAIDDALAAASGSTSDNKKGRKIHPRPVTLSGKSGGGGFLRGFDQLEKQGGSSSKKDSGAAPNRKTAKQLIFESGNVGTELRESKKSSGAAASTEFMKPAGVDEPTRRPKRKSDGARERPKKIKKTKTQDAT